MNLRSLLPGLTLLLAVPAAFAQTCATRVLVSGYFSGNVHVYDGCDGRFLRLLDTTSRGVAGAQTTRVGPDGLLYAVAELAGTVQRYNADTLDYIDTFITLPASLGGTGMDFGPDGDVYIAGYNSDTVRRYDGRSGAFKSELFARNTSVLNGPDIGMVFGPDGRLYIPGYDNHSVAVFNGTALSTLVPSRSGGLLSSRGIPFEPDGAHFWVSSEGGNRLLRIVTSSGAVARTVTEGIVAPVGMDYDSDGDLLVATGDGVLKLDPVTGARRKVLIAAGSGGLSGHTFLTVLRNAASEPEPTVDTAQIGSQYWVVGNAPLLGKVLDINLIVSATGTAFGSGFNAQAVQRKRWGRIRIEFTACDRALLNWDSTGESSAGFGSGGYELTRLFDSAATVACRNAGFAQSASSEWVSGTWYSTARSGEGILLDKDVSGEVFLAWFTHRPAG